MTCEEFEIIRATSADEDRVFEFLAQHYYPDHPLIKPTLHKMEKEDCPSSIILKSNFSLLAVRKDDPKIICGVQLFLKLGKFKDEMDALFDKRLKKYEGKPFGKVSQLLCDNGIALRKQVEEKSWKGIDKKDTMKVCIVSVRREDQQKELARTLARHGLEMVRKENCRWIIAESVSFRSLQLVPKLGFKVLSEVRYKDYFKDQDGNITLNIEPPHEAIVNLVMDLAPDESKEAVLAKL